jgi:hypothetical protein
VDGRSGGGSEKRNGRFRDEAFETTTALESEVSSPSSEVVEYDASMGVPSRKELWRQRPLAKGSHDQAVRKDPHFEPAS